MAPPLLSFIWRGVVIRTGRWVISFVIIVVSMSIAPITPSRAGVLPQTTIVSSARDGTQSNGKSYDADVSEDGRFIAFTSLATNLTSDAGGIGIYLKKRRTGAVERLDIAWHGRPGNYTAVSPSISANGRFIAFATMSRLIRRDRDGDFDVYVRDHWKNTTALIGLKPGRGHWPWEVMNPDISPDGRFVTFQTFRTRRHYGRTSYDAYITNRRTRHSELVSVSTDEETGDSSSFAGTVSNGGRYVTFVSYARNFSEVDSECCTDIYLRDRKEGTTSLVSVDSDEHPATGMNYEAHLSADAGYVFFSSYSPGFDEVKSNLADCFVRDLLVGRTHQVNVDEMGQRPSGHCFPGSISMNGRYIGFWTGRGERMIPGSLQVYFGRWRRGIVERVSVSPTGQPGNKQSTGAYLSGNANWIAFMSKATNLAPLDRNERQDIFIRGPMR